MSVQNDINIRPMRKADASQVARMIKEMAIFFDDTSSCAKADLVKFCFGPRKISTIFTATFAERVVGFAITRDWMNFYVTQKCRHIDFLFVTEKHRQSGVGKRLIAYVTKDALTNKCWRLSIDALIANKAARSLYEGLGFKKRATTTARYVLGPESMTLLVSERLRS